MRAGTLLASGTGSWLLKASEPQRREEVNFCGCWDGGDSLAALCCWLDAEDDEGEDDASSPEDGDTVTLLSLAPRRIAACRTA